MASESIYSFAVLRNRLVVRGELVALSALRVGSGRATGVLGNNLPVLRDAFGAPFVPGASLKGAFRARVEALVRAVQPTQAHDLEQIEAWQNTEIAKVKADTELANDRELSRAIWLHSTLIDLTFGAPWTAGRIFFKDAPVDRSLWFGQFEIRNGVALNRDTETAEQGFLYDYEVVPAGMRFAFELALENAAPWQLGLVLLALRPWQNGDAQIGGFRSRGLGHVQLLVTSARYHKVESADDVLQMLGYGDADAAHDLPLQRLPGVRLPPDSAEEPLEETPAQISEWFKAFRCALVDPQTTIREGLDA